MTYSRSLAVLCFIVVMLITALTPLGMPGPTTVDADYDEPATSHLLDPAEFPMAGGRIVRNVILGDPIPVCTDVVPLSALAAVQRWNDFFDDTMSTKVFELKRVRDSFSVYGANDPACKTRQTNPALGIGSVLIEEDSMACGGFACITLTTRAPNTDWDTYVGQLVIHLGNQVTDHMGVVIVEPVEDDVDRVTNSITHELGHVFGLANWKCGTVSEVASNPDVYTRQPTVMGPRGGHCRANDPTLGTARNPGRDKTDYQNSYIPAPPMIDEGMSGPGGANEAIIAWDALNVHVESGFAVEWKNAKGKWERVGTPHPAVPIPTLLESLLGRFPNELLTGQTTGKNTYRVVSLTRAPLQPATPPASGPHTITVKAPAPPSLGFCIGPDSRSVPDVGPDTRSCVWLPPTDLSVSDVSDTGAMLHWSDVDGAAGYKVRVDGVANRTKTLGVVNSHPFTGLTARTAHVLEVATTVSTGDSHFASLTLLVPPTNLAWTATTSAITLTWAGDTNARYEVKLGAGGTADDADSDTSHPFRLLASDTDYDLYVRAVNSQGPSAWASIAARTSAPSSPGSGIVIPTPCADKVRPADFETPRLSATDTETRWALVFVTPSFCLEYEETRTVTITVYAEVTYSCDGECWVAAAEVIETTTSSAWTRTGTSRVCNFPRSATPGQYSLSAGHYELEWAEERMAFTVPAGANVELAWRQQDGGAYVAVLSTKQGAELVVGADALSGDDQARSTRFAGTTDPTLSAIAASLRDPATAAPEPSVTSTTECAVAEPSADGVTSVDLDAASCAIVRGGGAVTVALDGESLAITLAAERDWLIINGTDTDEAGTTAATFVDLLTGGSITLALTDGSELSRHIPEGNTELPALLDVMIPAAPADDGS